MSIETNMQLDDRAEVYWDTQDPQNEGWAYRRYRDGEEVESGATCDGLTKDAMPGRVIKQAASEIGLPSTSVMLHRGGE